MTKRNKAGETQEEATANSAQNPEKPRSTLDDAAFRDFSEKRTDELVGFWDGETVLMFRPISVKLSDSKLDKTKPAVLIVAELLRPTELTKGKEDERESVDGSTGDTIGIWGKPGMRALRDLCGAECIMAPNGEKDTGKGNPMKLYDIRTKPGTPRRRLPITDDNRDKSRGVVTWVEEKADAPVASAGSSATGAGRGSDNIPF